jgi:hypothetical protein
LSAIGIHGYADESHPSYAEPARNSGVFCVSHTKTVQPFLIEQNRVSANEGDHDENHHSYGKAWQIPPVILFKR